MGCSTGWFIKRSHLCQPTWVLSPINFADVLLDDSSKARICVNSHEFCHQYIIGCSTGWFIKISQLCQLTSVLSPISYWMFYWVIHQKLAFVSSQMRSLTKKLSDVLLDDSSKTYIRFKNLSFVTGEFQKTLIKLKSFFFRQLMWVLLIMLLFIRCYFYVFYRLCVSQREHNTVYWT